MSYPELITVSGRDYKINTDYRDALACFACINDPEINDVERTLGVLGILYKEIPENIDEALRMAVKYLRCGKNEKDTEQKPDMDFEYDENYIKSSFMSDYRIDLDDVELHWWKFCNLLQGLTDGCILNRVRDLRNYDTSSIKDPTARRKLLKAQRELALPEHMSQEDQDTLDAFYAQLTQEGNHEDSDD